MAGEKAVRPDGAELTSTYPDDEQFRVHVSYVWLRPIVTSLTVAAALVMGNLNQALDALRAAQAGLGASLPVALLASLACLALVYLAFVGLSWLRWRNLTYSFTQDGFTLSSGIVSKQRVHLPYERVQSVGHQATLPQRLIGVCNATVESAGGSGNTAIKIPYLTLSEVERLRAEFFVRRAARRNPGAVLVLDASARAEDRSAPLPPTAPGSLAPPGTPAADAGRERVRGSEASRLAGAVGSWRGVLGGDEAPARTATAGYARTLSNAELLFASISLSSFLPRVFAMTAVLVGAVMPTLLTVLDLGAPAYDGLAFAALAASVVLAVGRTALQVGGFTVRREGGRVETEMGVVSHRFSGFEADRVQALVVRQGVLHRLARRCEVRVEKIAAPDAEVEAGGDGGKGTLLHPFLPLAQLDGFLDEVLPELGSSPARSEMEPLPRVALRRALVRWVFLRAPWVWLALAGTAAHARLAALVPPEARVLGGPEAWLVVLLAACAVGTAAQAAGAVLWSRGSGLLLEDDRAAIRNDGLTVSTAIVPRRKAQSFAARTNPFQRRAHVATVICSYAAMGAQTFRLVDVAGGQADAWVRWLQPRGGAIGGRRG